MPKIVLSIDKTTWVGKELYPGEQYISFDEYKFNVNPSNIILNPELTEVETDIERLLNITITSLTPITIIKLLAKQLCNPEYTNNKCLYFSNYKAMYGVSKCLNPNFEYVVK